MSESTIYDVDWGYSILVASPVTFTLDYDMFGLDVASNLINGDFSVFNKSTNTRILLNPITGENGVGTMSVNLNPGIYSLSIDFTSIVGGTTDFVGNVIALFDWQITNQNTSAQQSLTAAAAPAPEPASWTMMLGGFGLLGGVMRGSRRNKKAALA